MEQVVDIPELQELNEAIELGESLERLRKNKDFKKIIQSRYIEEGLKTLSVNLPVARNAEVKQRLFDKIEARGILLRDFHDIIEKYRDALQAKAMSVEEGE